MKPADVACVVLASGLSQRFGGTDKLQAELCGKAVLDYVLETVTSVGFGENFIVSQKSSPQGFTQVVNNDPESGQGHALRLGLGAAKAAGWDSIAVILGDMPLVEPSHLWQMIEKIGTNHAVASVFGDQKMPPALFRGTAVTEILTDRSSVGARTIFHRLNPVTVPFSAEAALDVDTPEDLARVAAIMKARTT